MAFVWTLSALRGAAAVFRAAFRRARTHPAGPPLRLKGSVRMKTRIIVGATAIPLFLLLIFFAPLWAYAIVVGLICCGCAWEFLRCVDPNMNPRFKIYAAATAFALPVIYVFFPNEHVPAALLYLLTVLMILALLLSFKEGEARVKLETVLQVLFAGSVMPMLLLPLVRIGMRAHSSIYVLLPLLAAAACDTGAYFVGSFLGRRKIFPHLSPNKTWEGCIGGIVIDVGVMLLYAFVLTRFKLEVNYLSFAVYGFAGALACEFGDLAFSAIKREYGVKDYGALIPGHGGMLDRFDSMHFTAPMIELLVLWLPALK